MSIQVDLESGVVAMVVLVVLVKLLLRSIKTVLLVRSVCLLAN